MKLGAQPITLRQLQYVVAVAEARNFRRAAQLCHVSQPSLSAQLAQLEEALGVRLFERGRSGVLPTSAGAELIERARKLVLDADDLVESARRLGDPFTGTIRIGVIPTISPYLLPHAAPALRARYPRLTVAWTEEKTDSLVRLLGAGEIDAALLALEADIGEVESAAIARDPFVLATPHGHPLAVSCEPAALRELRDACVLLLDDGHCFREQALEVCSAARTEEAAFRATSLSTLAQMVASGAGITLLPELAVETEQRRAAIDTRPLGAPQPHRTVALVWRPRSSLRAALRQLAATIRDAYPGGAAVSRPDPRARKPPRRRA
ncbi:MAG: LysR family transcriptional regulator [Deltaproteobacteria bacterium]|nr:LysR family transcriptional regulator [Deltaproteobacteria bacterium]